MTHTAQQHRTHERRIAGMLADPELLGDLLLVGIVFARSLDFGDPPLERLVKECAETVYGRAYHATQLHGRAERDEHGSFYPRAADHGVERVKDVLRSDIRRYVANAREIERCRRPVNRRRAPHGQAGPLMQTTNLLPETGSPPGTRSPVCGRRPDWRDRGPFWLVDPVDGTRHAFAACSQPRCKKWLTELMERNAAEVAANPPPKPVANRGGILARHLDEIDWPRLYHQLDPKWTPPHEAPGWRPPKLQVVIGDDDPSDGPAVTGRPSLTVIEGGWA